MTEPTFELLDYQNETHCKAFLDLLTHYMLDPMGDHTPLNPEKQSLLLERMAANPAAFVTLMSYDGIYAGMTTSFELLSTFYVKPYLYIHDVVVHKDYRGKGLGKALLMKMADLAKERGCCKLTLEVREDNTEAKKLYQSLGYKDCDPVMYFWTKTL